MADTSLWCLGGNTAITFAEKDKNVWKLMALIEFHEHRQILSEQQPKLTKKQQPASLT